MINGNEIAKLATRVLESQISVGVEDCRGFFEEWERYFDDILYWANKIRRYFKGNKVKFCSIVNAKSGMCSEDCRFCAQSSFSRSDVKIYPLLDKDEIVESYENCAKKGVSSCFGIVTSGESVSGEEIRNIGEAIDEIKKKNFRVKISASLGRINFESLSYLKKMGLDVYHHNLETAESFFSKICTTHSYESKLNTIRAVKKAGLKLCSGGLFGIGETMSERLELADTLKKYGPPDSIPLNFLNPIKGTPLYTDVVCLSPKEILATIAAFRFLFPDKDIRVCGGREVNLRDMQSWIFYAGANGTMTGGYLTTGGRQPEEDTRMIKDLGLEIE